MGMRQFTLKENMELFTRGNAT